MVATAFKGSISLRVFGFTLTGSLEAVSPLKGSTEKMLDLAGGVRRLSCCQILERIFLKASSDPLRRVACGSIRRIPAHLSAILGFEA